MKCLRYCLVPLFSVVLCLSVSGCKASHASDGWPRALHYAFSPQSEQLQGGSMNTGLMRQYLQDQLHIPVDVVRVQGHAPTIEAMRAGKVDIAHFGALAYLIAAQEAGAQAIVSRGTPDGALGGYHAMIAVPKDSPIHSMQELKARAKSAVFTFAEPASTSGDLYPRVGLMALGIDPERDFKRVLYADGHLGALMSIISGKVDAGAFDEMFMTRLISKGKMKPGDIRILWTSELIPNEPIAVRGSLPEQLKKEIQAAILAIPTKNPQLWASMHRNVYSATYGNTYIPVNDATYDPLRRYALQVKQFNFLEK